VGQLNASVDAKGAKEDRKERKGKKKKESFLSSLRPWYFLFAFFASTLAFNSIPTHVPHRSQHSIRS
jgi:hypothetical protein